MTKTLPVLFLALLPALASAAPVGPLSVYLVEPCRLLDTRTSAGRISGDRAIVVRSTCEVPAEAVGIVVNVTALEATDAGHVVLWDGVVRPPTSVLNFVPGAAPVANEVTVRLRDLAGSVPVPPIPDMTITTAAPVNILLDVTGYLR